MEYARLVFIHTYMPQIYDGYARVITFRFLSTLCPLRQGCPARLQGFREGPAGHHSRIREPDRIRCHPTDGTKADALMRATRL